MTRHLVQPNAELSALASRSTAELLDVIESLVRARVLADVSLYSRSMADAAALFAQILALSDVLGRRRMNLLWERASDGVDATTRAVLAAEATARLDAGVHPLLPRVEARDAVRDILSRHPEIAPGYEAVRELYATRHSFACARSLDVAVTDRVRDLIGASLRGEAPPNVRKVLAEVGGWAQAYADTVYRTNVSTAYSAGMWARLTEPEVARVLPGARFVSQLLPTSRRNHTACHGLTAPTTSSLWDVYSPPLGYACVCGLREVSVFEARREGLIDGDGRFLTVLPPRFSEASPDEGFGRGRPDRRAAFGELAA